MGRPSSLTDKQWGEIGKRLAAGEGVTFLANEFKVAKSTISNRFSKRIETLRRIANNMVETEKEFKSLPIDEQYSVSGMVESLRSIGNNLAAAANFGSATAARLHQLAHGQVEQIPQPEKGMPVDLLLLPGIAALTKVANEAASIGTAFMVANKPKEDPNAGQGNKDELLREIAAMLPN